MTAAWPLALLCGISLASAAISLLALGCVRYSSGAGRQARADTRQIHETVDQLQRSLLALAGEMRDLQQGSVPAPADGVFRSGLNLNRRSQALRMHRRGDPPEQIAASLGVSRQEVDLLLKVHRIVMSRF